jgi:hypothetical protein
MNRHHRMPEPLTVGHVIIWGLEPALIEDEIVDGVSASARRERARAEVRSSPMGLVTSELGI